MHALVDCHSHVYPEWFLRRLERRSSPPRVVETSGERVFQPVAISGNDRSPLLKGQPIAAGFWEIQEKFALMDRLGIDRAVISVGNPWAAIWDGRDSLEVCRRLNADIISLAAEHSARLAALISLPNSSIPEVAELIAAAAESRSVVGIISGTTICGLPLDAAELEPIWAAAETAGFTLFVHPSHGLCHWGELSGYGALTPLGVGFPAEVSLSVLRLGLSGVLSRHPALRLLLPHGGGILISVLDRLRLLVDSASADAGARLDELIRASFVDSIQPSLLAAQAAAGLFGSDHVVLGTDHPFLIGGETEVEFTMSRASSLGYSFGAAAFYAFPRLRNWWPSNST